MPASTNVGPSKPRLNPQTKTPVAGPVTPSLNPQTKTPAAKAPVRPAGAAVTTPSPNQAAAQAAANSSSSFQQYLQYTQTNMGRTAQQIINGMTKPIIDAYTAQQKAGDQSIVNSTQTYVNELNNISGRAEGAYTTAENQQSALDTALGTALQGGDVGAAASKLTQALAAAGQDTTPGVAAQAAANQTGASVYAGASASLSQLFAQGANQKAFDAQQPGLARGAGLQALTSYNAGLTDAEQKAVQAAQDKLPAIMSALNTAQKTQLATQAEAFKESQPKIYGSGSSGYFALLPDGRNVQLTAPGAKAPKVFGSASSGYYTIGSNGQTTQLTAPVPKAPPKPGAPHTKTVGGTTYQWNGSKWTPAPGIPGGKGGGRGTTLTSGEEQSFLKGLPVYQRKNGVSTKVGARMDYQKAYQYLTSHGVDDQTARSDLATVYPKGWHGRAWLTNEEQAVLKPYLSRQPMTMPGGFASIKQMGIIGETSSGGKTYGVLGANQAAILKAHNALPKGQFYNDPKLGRVYLIDPNG